MLKFQEIIMLQKTINDVEREYGRLNIAEVARRSGYNKRTIMKYARPTDECLTQKQTPRPTKLDPYKEFILSELVIKPKIPGTVIYHKILQKGYTGKYAQVTKYLRENRPKQPKPAVLRYETDPGEQGQVDWGTLCKVDLEGKMHNVYVFAIVLGYSRVIYAEITLSQSEMVFLQCMENAFRYFGGIPKRILFDNTKTVIIKKAFDYKKNEWNKTFKDFSEYYGFSPSTHLPYHPQTKGKIERTIRYIKDNFFASRDFASVDDIQQQLQGWLSEANSRIHGTTKKVPFEQLKKELPKLRDINLIPPYPIIVTEERQISPDFCLSFRGNKYSVPYQYARKKAILKISADSFDVYCDNVKICTHKIAHGSNRSIILKEHSKGLLKETMDRNRKKNPAPEIYELKFKDLSVEERSLDAYDIFALGGGNQ